MSLFNTFLFLFFLPWSRLFWLLALLIGRLKIIKVNVLISLSLYFEFVLVTLPLFLLIFMFQISFLLCFLYWWLLLLLLWNMVLLRLTMLLRCVFLWMMRLVVGGWAHNEYKVWSSLSLYIISQMQGSTISEEVDQNLLKMLKEESRSFKETHSF